MRLINTVCLIGFGEVGGILAEDLLTQTDADVTAWDVQFNSESANPSQRVVAFEPSTRFTKASDAASAVAQADLVISAVTASQALQAASVVADAISRGTWYVDLNSVSPETKNAVAHVINNAGGRFVEAAVMAPISPRRVASPILLGGPEASEFVAIGHALGFTGMKRCSDQIGRASATKMCRSVVIKGMEALVTEALLAAQHYDVTDDVLVSLNNLIPHADWNAQAQYLISRSQQHGIRRAEEMREVAITVNQAGVTPWMSEACVERQHWAGTHNDNPDLTGLLENLLAQSQQAKPESNTKEEKTI